MVTLLCGPLALSSSSEPCSLKVRWRDLLVFLRPQNWAEAVKWYKSAIDIVDEDENPRNSLLTDSNYTLYAAQARLYQVAGYGLNRVLQSSGDVYSAAGDLLSSGCYERKTC